MNLRQLLLLYRNLDKLNGWKLTAELSITELECLVYLLEVATLGHVLHVSVLIVLGRPSYFADLVDLPLELILHNGGTARVLVILLVASDKDRHFSVQDVEVVDDVIQNLSRFSQFLTILAVNYEYKALYIAIRHLLYSFPKVKVSGNVNTFDRPFNRLTFAVLELVNLSSTLAGMVLFQGADSFPKLAGHELVEKSRLTRSGRAHDCQSLKRLLVGLLLGRRGRSRDLLALTFAVFVIVVEGKGPCQEVQ